MNGMRLLLDIRFFVEFEFDAGCIFFFLIFAMISEVIMKDAAMYTSKVIGKFPSNSFS